MSVNSDIRDGLIAIMKTAQIGEKTAFSAEVTAVDIAARTCTVTSLSDSNGVEYSDVWLMPQIDDGILYVPKIGSTVLVNNDADTRPYVVMWSAVDTILYVAGNSTVQIDKDGVKLDGDKFGGLVEVVPSVKAWNDIQNDINTLKSLIQTLATTPTVTTAPGTPDGFYVLFAATMASYYPTLLTLTTRAELENTKVQHGDGT